MKYFNTTLLCFLIISIGCKTQRKDTTNSTYENASISDISELKKPTKGVYSYQKQTIPKDALRIEGRIEEVENLDKKQITILNVIGFGPGAIPELPSNNTLYFYSKSKEKEVEIGNTYILDIMINSENNTECRILDVLKDK